jgi:hypothetical protein
MSKNKGGKNTKKEPAIHSSNTISDYQASKQPAAKEVIPVAVKGK